MNKKIDLWHYPRPLLAKQIMSVFESGLAHALTLFAPRRMGKTEFLLKDIVPLAQQEGWSIFYFSFLDIQADAAPEFLRALQAFLTQISMKEKSKTFFKQVAQVGVNIHAAGAGVGAQLQFKETPTPSPDIKTILHALAQQDKVLLLLDEVQVLAQKKENARLIAGLRTALDIDKDQVKVIFTGSSQEGLRRMFSEAKAPFFHFGQNLDFPELDQGFTQHMAKRFQTVTGRPLAVDALWDLFITMHKVPFFLRSLVERLALHPEHSLEQAYALMRQEMTADQTLTKQWHQCSILEQLILKRILDQPTGLFSEATRQDLQKILGIRELPAIATIQSALRSLENKGLICHPPSRGHYQLEDPLFQEWLLQVEPAS